MSFSQKNQGGKMLIFTAPSGAGKTTIVRHLLNTFDFLDFSISVTTRERRPHEIEGKDYFFRSVEEFQHLIKTEKLAEWEEVYEGRFYGTLKSEVDRIWQSGRHSVFDIDVKGAANLQLQYPSNCKSTFIKPPSIDILIERLTNRKTESADSLEKRIKKAKIELCYESVFHQVLINDDLSAALKNAEKIAQSFIFGENHQ